MQSIVQIHHKQILSTKPYSVFFFSIIYIILCCIKNNSLTLTLKITSYHSSIYLLMHSHSHNDTHIKSNECNNNNNGKTSFLYTHLTSHLQVNAAWLYLAWTYIYSYRKFLHIMHCIVYINYFHFFFGIFFLHRLVNSYIVVSRILFGESDAAWRCLSI